MAAARKSPPQASAWLRQSVPGRTKPISAIAATMLAKTIGGSPTLGRSTLSTRTSQAMIAAAAISPATAPVHSKRGSAPRCITSRHARNARMMRLGLSRVFQPRSKCRIDARQIIRTVRIDSDSGRKTAALARAVSVSPCLTAISATTVATRNTEAPLGTLSSRIGNASTSRLAIVRCRNLSGHINSCHEHLGCTDHERRSA